ncbi:MAG TPA: NAD(P)H-dependent oxidoreductase [Kofleriaceae bacterium]|nr:NAD(P)H-dependent oxidoreductase [Kofleriaceae bacterium]
MRDVALIVGSLRNGSFTRIVASTVAELAPSPLRFVPVEIGALPLYNQDLETDSAPPPWVDFRNRVRDCEAVLFATPEYNRSIPGALKNAIDVGSRPYGKSVWSGKPAAIISVSPGAVGAFGANHHLRQCLVFLDMPCMQQPEAYLGNITESIDADKGRVKAGRTRDYLQTFAAAFARWVDQVAPAHASAA